jgi:hypothetical protein
VKRFSGGAWISVTIKLLAKSSRHGLAVARGRLQNQLSDRIFPPKTSAANETLPQHLWKHRDAVLTFLHPPGLDATN